MIRNQRHISLGLLLLCATILVSIESTAQNGAIKYDNQSNTLVVKISDRTAANVDSLLETLGFQLEEVDDLFARQERLKSDRGWKLVDCQADYIEFRKPLASMSAELNIKELFREKFWEDDYKSMAQDVTYGVNDFKDMADAFYPADFYRFYIHAPKAQHVVLSGTFNEWDTEDLVMKRNKGGDWYLDLALDPGQHLYKFIVDGHWIIDLNNRIREDDLAGNRNSVFYAPNQVFRLEGYQDARKVYIAGSFNAWRPKHIRMNKRAGGWEIPMYLREGSYTYKFIVDGEWILDPSNPDKLDDGMGNKNSYMEFGDPTTFRYAGHPDADKVYLSGEFNGWNYEELLMKREGDEWVTDFVLAPGNYEYRYVADGEWLTDMNAPYIANDGNNIMCVEPNHRFFLEGLGKANNVRVSGDFNGWNTSGYPLKKVDGGWMLDVFLPMGKTRYRFIVDGEWMHDYANPWYEHNEFNSKNSVVWKGPDDVAP